MWSYLANTFSSRRKGEKAGWMEKKRDGKKKKQKSGWWFAPAPELGSTVGSEPMSFPFPSTHSSCFF